MPGPTGPTAGEPDADLLRRLLLEKYEPIAVIGIGLRLPGGNETPESYATFLRTGSDGTGPIPADRWDAAAFRSDDPAARGTIRTEGGGFLDDIDLFDPAFFAISPKEADYIDPQQRLVLETAWSALEDAGIDVAALRGANGGVYVGISSADYMVAAGRLPQEAIDGYLGAGTSHSAASGRLSYFLGWQGPCASYDTACSSSLVALDAAVRDLRQHQADIALAGGVNLAVHPQPHIVCSQANMLTEGRRCRTFDDDADGYARSEGAGMLVLKRLSDARRDQDRVLALVRGCAIRQDGESAGLTVPNGSAQQRVMRAALENAAVVAGDVQYVEAHGTGTAVGDPIEMAAIAKVFAASHTRERPVLVASGKTNIGHNEPAAGISGLIKTILQLVEGRVFPHLNLDRPSTRIPWDELPVRVPVTCEPWPAEGVRRALVNSFGFAGTIASAVLEQAPESPPAAAPPEPAGPHVFPLSAATRRALPLQARAHHEFLVAHPDVGVAEYCRAAAVSRTHLPARAAGVVGDRAALLAQLDRLAEAAPEPVAARQVAFLFSGQGSQYPGMAAAAYRRHPVFAEVVDECDQRFAEELGDGSRITGLLTDPGTDPAVLGRTLWTQPALFTFEYALASLWASWGVRPDVVLGHSIGEVVAATVAGVLTLPDAVRLVAHRARLMDSVRTPGAMLAVRAGRRALAPLLADRDDLALAAVNGPEQCVLSGTADAIAEAAARLAADGVGHKALPVSQAFHSPLMDEILAEFEAVVATIELAEPRVTLVSNLTGEVVDADQIRDPGYWARLIREPVDFAGGMRTVAGRGPHVMLEVGPGRTLVNAGRACVAPGAHQWLTSADSADPDAALPRALAGLYAAGIPVSWAGVHEHRPRPDVTLPGYRFDRKRHWMPAARPETAAHPLLGGDRSTPQQLARGEREFAGAVSASSPAYLADHVVGEQVVFPVAGFVEVLVAAVDAVHGDAGRAVRGLLIHEPLLLDETPILLRTRLRPGADGSTEIEVFSTPSHGDGPERRHVTATVDPAGADGGDLTAVAAGLLAEAGDTEAGHLHTNPQDRVTELYDRLDSSGLHYGRNFRRVTGLTPLGERHAQAELAGPAGVPAEHLPPPILDSALQTTLLDWTLAEAAGRGPGLPVRLGAFQLFSRPRGSVLRSVVRLEPAPAESGFDAVGEVVVTDGDRLVCVLHELWFRRLAQGGARRRLLHRANWLPRAGANAGAPRTGVLVHGPGAPRVLTVDGAELTIVDGLDGLSATLEQRPDDVFWCWRPRAGHDLPGLRDECAERYTELLELVRLLDRHGFGSGQRLWLVTAGGQWLPGDAPAATADDERRLAAATLWGFGAVLANEYPTQLVTLLDLPPGEDPDPAVLVREASSAEPDELQIAYRAGVRHVRRIEPCEPGPAPAEPAVDDRHTYVVTGGFGGLGPLTARVLAGRGARHLALVGRRVPADVLARVRADVGDEVTVHGYAADISDADAVDELFKLIGERGPAVGGIVHGAGVLADRPVAALDRDAMDTVFRTKVYGSWLLHRAAEKLPELRFFTGYASSSTIFGQSGQANYAAGNAFLDMLMHWRIASGRPGTALDWGPWAEIGMAAALDEQRRAAFARQGIHFLRPQDGAAALSQLLAGPEAQVIVGESDWTAFAASRPTPNGIYELVARRTGRAETAVDVGALRKLPPGERAAGLSELVRATVAGVLHYDDADDIPADTAFTQLGLDSLAAVEVKNKLEAVLGVPLPVSALLDHPTTDSLVVLLDGLLTGGDGAGADDADEPGWDLADADAELAALKELGT